MDSISIFDIFKLSIGPSSSHTLGPWKSALDFISEIENLKIDKLKIELYGSLSKTGKGHATDKAIQLGLLGFDPEMIETDKIEIIVAKLQSGKRISIGCNSIVFSSDMNFIRYQKNKYSRSLTTKT